MQFPFSENTSYEDGGFIGKSFSVYANQTQTNSFELIDTVTFMASGRTAEGWQWRVEDGGLHIADDTGRTRFSFNGVELVNGRVVAVGLEVANRVARRVVMCAKDKISDVEIRVSSCKKHGEIVPVLLKSMRRDGVPDDQVTVIVGSVPYAEEFDKTFDNIRYVSDERDMRGFTALSCGRGPAAAGEQLVEEDKRYMLLHDTCQVGKGFHQWLENVDVGLNPDIILLRPPEEGLELGIYSGSFLMNQEDLETFKQAERLNVLLGRASVVIVVGGHAAVNAPEDHYFDGRTRQEMVFARPHVTKFKKALKTGRRK